jgi:hypothetical protein
MDTVHVLAEHGKAALVTIHHHIACL